MVSLGTVAIVDASAINTIDIAQLSSTLAIVAYAETTNVKARTVTIADPPTINAEANVENGALWNNANDEIVLVGLTSTSAMIIYKNGVLGTTKAKVLTVSGTTINTSATPLTLSDTLLGGPTNLSGCLVTSTNVMVAYSDSATGAGTAVILSISGTTITEHTPEQFESIVFGGAGSTKCTIYSTSKAIVTFINTSSIKTYGNIIDISGTTLSANTEKEIGINSSGDENQQSYLAGMSSTKVVFGVNAGSNTTSNIVLTLNGSDFDIGTQEDIAGASVTGVNAGTPISETSLLVSVRENTSDDLLVTQLDISGVGDDELTVIDSDTLALSSILYIKSAPVDSSNVIIHYIGSSSSVVLASVAAALSLAPMTKPADIDAAGEFIYLALLEGGTPILTKISTALDADGTTVFNPGAGDNIGVECGRFNSDVVWVAGQFDGTNVVEKSEDGGSSFSVADDATIGGVKSFVMGPDSDSRILVFDEDNGDILETTDGGQTWTSINASVTPEVNAIARLGKNVQESVFGNEGAANDNVNYSVNSGDDLEDFNLPVNQDVTQVIVN